MFNAIRRATVTDEKQSNAPWFPDQHAHSGSIPIGKTRDVLEDQAAPELPVGIEVLGLPLRETHMLSVGAGVEAAQKGV